MIYIETALILISVALAYVSVTYGVVAAFAALCVAGMFPGVSFGWEMYVFWGVAALIVVALHFTLPRSVSSSRTGVPYIVTASLAGMLAGLAVSHAAMTVGSAVAAVLGGVAFARTPSGRQLGFPSRRFWNYLCAKALPAVIALSIIGTIIQLMIID